MPTLFRNFILFILALLVIAGVLSTFQMGGATAERIDVGKLITQVRSGEVRRIEIKGDSLLIELKSGAKEVAQKESGESLSSLLKNYGVAPEAVQGIEVAVKRQSGFGYWISVLLPFLIPFFLIGLVIFFMMRQVQGVNNRAMSFGQSGAREVTPEAKNRVAFKDVAGLEESKEELREIVEFLKNPKKFTVLGAKIPKGVLLMGSPGTGKTLLARAVAGEANVPFFHIAGSEFVEMFVGVGASRVRDLFRKAKKAAPCILFIDEIDAVGRQRGSGLGGSHDEREQTLNQILVEMDGFDPHVGIIVMAATNRPDILDPALLRPGRFDRRVVLDLPDIKDREEILKIHARGKPLAKNVNLKTIAQRTPGFSGADLANLINEGAILTARRNKKEVGMAEMIEAIEKVMLGPERKSHILSENEKKVTAYHEGGHAIVGHELPGADPVRKISIVSRGRAAGYTLKLPSEDRHLKTRAEFLDEIAALLGGYVAEHEVFGDVTTGASNDLKVATGLAKKLVTEYGMSETLGPRTFGERDELIFLGREITEQRDYSEEIARVIDQEIDKIIRGARYTAERVIREKRDILNRIVARLLEKETIEQEEFDSFFTSGKAEVEKKAKGPQKMIKKSARIIPQLGGAVV
ncbi:cell division protein FtsH [Candidatus Uhrbacteria bacterium RIFCSPLOWO2_01_FULL_47_24]|uniref:ATP-dependent zinc metalloprotease FtsH n=1 Tax=Candidatus Uhrbacteria bacterium RIFCSPLOWO2_01_FULL_47_24 TaxID=1802401 RepID=A0A1F7UTA2_9BACT|nr:MAG: cell division protein FtsH [Candidatus Uhrbacteria bacterium RIFCSPHIGHO2_01_FULL_47_11]OGL69115.1 MAG: cell division protein FtsH [Candidatus Uhrbacteria bacterium RIFCSPHIGHO2_02_FULL_46_47]OGL75726.1 MAG: cell division protein FtsH [Candidatus Uhrbacteria bacterium RIFCSPHIGHO2_12_FULL_47_11]OGL81486.1 MAG: cell division protein FtsH [Candidatus Uhrbacteria bacterium RIFCSPLOWO2_01_FULL_47_24]OGL83731.1 MAG: cell division protein FtsH [Candidatus Uhrbacteria bacterium RIFCSPLOWO2_02_